MNKKEIKAIWKLAYSIWKISVTFWLLETIVFLLVEGWHYKATSPIEIYCDKIVSNMWLFALNVTVVTCVYFLININRKRKRNNLT